MKNFILIFLSIFFIVGCNSNANNKSSAEAVSDSDIPPLLDRKGQLATATEWQKTKQKVDELKMKIAQKPSDVKPRLQLATIYIAEARITGEHPYYYPATHKILDGVLAIDSRNFEAIVYKASVKLSQHKFKEAKALAEQARNINPNNAYVYGLLVDANVELGNYEEAVANSDKMQSIKPSLEAYSRASYLREIFGDYKGAIKAMELAVQAGLPGSEPQCWSQNTLADLYYKTGDLEKSELAYRGVLSMRPSYAFALAGLAKIEQKKMNYDNALKLLDSAAAIMPEFSFYEQMGDIYALQGDNDKAQKKYAEVKEMLDEDAKSGHLVNLELAKLYVKMNKFDLAKKHAMEEYAVRPANIDVNKELAWIAYKENDMKKSKEYLQLAKRTGSKDPELMERLAIITGSQAKS